MKAKKKKVGQPSNKIGKSGWGKRSMRIHRNDNWQTQPKAGIGIAAA